MGTSAAPLGRQDRISELDIIRGFALFGVLWMNLYQHAGFIIPVDHLAKLPTAPLDQVVSFFSRWLMLGKAQALFSMLFGFGFAVLYDRVSARGVDAAALYVRRLAILFVIGLAHLFLLWMGDILHAYALAGFLLLLTRRWPSWLLLSVGLALSVLTLPLAELWYVVQQPGREPPWVVAEMAGQARRWPLFQQSDYLAFVQENARGIWSELYSNPLGLAILGWIFGRFLIGAWVYRQGWLQDSARYAQDFRRWAAILLVAGLLIGAIRPGLTAAGVSISGVYLPLSLGAAFVGIILQALAYAAIIVVLCQSRRWRARLSGLGAVGQMALTNYVAQSLVFVFVLYGFGLGLLPYNGPTFALGLAIVTFALQVAYSRWWLARYRFGPLEWVWRTLTYGEKQPMRLRPQPLLATPAQ